MREIDLTYIVDDDKIFTFSIKKIMELNQFSKEVITFPNGAEAIVHLKKVLDEKLQLPDIILLDLNMPVMDGWQFLDEFKGIDFGRKITIYIVSSSIDPLDHVKAKEYSSVSSFLVKPITRVELEAVFNQWKNAE